MVVLTSRSIAFTDIDFTDNFFCLLPFTDTKQAIQEDLARSIKAVGILHPPILLQRDSTVYSIVSGFKRLTIARKTQKKIHCLILAPSTHPQHCLEIALEDSLTSHPLSPIERAVFLKKMRSYYSDKELAENFLPRLNMTGSTILVEKSCSLLQLEFPLQTAVHSGVIDEKAAHQLLQLDMRDRLALYDIITALHLSVGNQKKVISSLHDLAKRRKTSIHTLLCSKDIKNILNHSTANTPQKTTLLANWLNRERFPRLLAAEKEFKIFRDNLNLPNNVSLTPSRSFERDNIGMTIDWKNKENLAITWPEIKKIIDDGNR